MSSESFTELYLKWLENKKLSGLWMGDIKILESEDGAYGYSNVDTPHQKINTIKLEWLDIQMKIEIVYTMS